MTWEAVRRECAIRPEDTPRTHAERCRELSRWTRHYRADAARQMGNPHRGMVPGGECPRAFQRAIMSEFDPAPVWLPLPDPSARWERW